MAFICTFTFFTFETTSNWVYLPSLLWVFLVVQIVKNLPAMQETWVCLLEDNNCCLLTIDFSMIPNMSLCIVSTRLINIFYILNWMILWFYRETGKLLIDQKQWAVTCSGKAGMTKGHVSWLEYHSISISILGYLKDHPDCQGSPRILHLFLLNFAWLGD